MIAIRFGRLGWDLVKLTTLLVFGVFIAWAFVTVMLE